MRLTSLPTNKSLMELTTHGSEQFPIQYYFDVLNDYEQGHIPWHWHTELELLSVTTGSMQCHIGNHQIVLQQGEGLFVNSGILHKFETKHQSNNTVTENIVFSPELIATRNSVIYSKYILPFLSSLNITHIILKKSNHWQNQILEALQHIYDIWEQKQDGYELSITLHINKIWQLLWAHKDEFIAIPNASSTLNTQVRIKQMISFIEQNYQNPITLNDIALSANISKSEALRCFKTNIDVSPVDYLINYRIHTAAHQLLTTQSSVSDIAMSCGFSTIGYFDRIFKRNFKVSPREYRKKHE